VINLDLNTKTNRLKISCERENINQFELLREHFSVPNTNAVFIRKYRRGVPSRMYAITATGTCEAGLFFEIIKYFKKNHISYNVSEELKKWLLIGFDNSNIIFGNYTNKLRDYQTDFLSKALEKGRGVCVVGTGGGKTLITAALIENYYKRFSTPNTFKTLVVVPNPELADQTQREFVKENVSFTSCIWTGKNDITEDVNVIVCNISILQSRFEQEDYDWVQYVDLLIFDECHKNRKNNVIGKIINKIKTPHKYGFTGTLPNNLIDKWSIIGKLGPVIYEKDSYELRQEKYLTEANVIFLKLIHNNVPKLDYNDELEYIFTNKFRNNIIKKLCDKLENNILILTNRLIHGDLLYEFLKQNTNKRVYYIKGEVEIDIRNEIKSIMEQHNNVICIAMNQIFSTGINVKNIHNIIFASAGKAFITIVQSIGRGLRLSDNKDILKIFDISDNFKYSLRHAEKRQHIYNKEKIKTIEKTIREDII